MTRSIAVLLASMFVVAAVVAAGMWAAAPEESGQDDARGTLTEDAQSFEEDETIVDVDFEEEAFEEEGEDEQEREDLHRELRNLHREAAAAQDRGDGAALEELRDEIAEIEEALRDRDVDHGERPHHERPHHEREEIETQLQGLHRELEELHEQHQRVVERSARGEDDPRAERLRDQVRRREEQIARLEEVQLRREFQRVDQMFEIARHLQEAGQSEAADAVAQRAAARQRDLDGEAQRRQREHFGRAIDELHQAVGQLREEVESLRDEVHQLRRAIEEKD